MGTLPLSTSGDEGHAKELHPQLDRQIERIRDFLDAQQEKLDGFRQELDAKQAEWRRLAESKDRSHSRERLDPVGSDGQTGEETPAGILDQETERQRILTALESDSGQQGPGGGQEQLDIQAVVQKTDRLLAEKDHQIQASRNRDLAPTGRDRPRKVAN